MYLRPPGVRLECIRGRTGYLHPSVHAAPCKVLFLRADWPYRTRAAVFISWHMVGTTVAASAARVAFVAPGAYA